MSLTVVLKTISIINGNANDGSQVDQMFSDVYNNCSTIASYINDNCVLKTGPNTFTGTQTFPTKAIFSASVALATASDPASPIVGDFWYSVNSNAFEGLAKVANISNATNVTPIVVTTLTAHGMTTGQTAYIAGVVGNTAANGTWVVTVLDTVTIRLTSSVGNGAYVSGGALSVIRQVLSPSVALAATKGQIFGLLLSNNGATPNTDVDIAAGHAVDDTGVDLMVYGGGTKRFSSTFVVGTGNGASDTGTIPTSGTLHVYLIKRTDTGVVDVFCSTSLTPVLPTGYTLKRRIGSITTDASAHMGLFRQDPIDPDIFEYTTPGALDVDVTNQSTTSVTRTLAVPTGIQVKARLNVIISNSTPSQRGVYFLSLGLTDVAPSITATPLSTFITENNSATGDFGGGPLLEILTNTSGQIATRATGANTVLKICTTGWKDTRGRNN